MDMPGFFKEAAAVAPLGASLYKPPVTSPGTQDTPGIPDEPCCHTPAPAEQTRHQRPESLRPGPEAQRCGPIPLGSCHRRLPTVRWKADGRMPDGPLVPDPGCGRCHKKREMVVRTEAVSQDELWFHPACHRAGAGQRLRATRLAAVLKDVKRGVEIITSPLF
jgi:hypothetical protein